MRPDTVMRWIVAMLLGWTLALADGPPAGAPPPAPVLVSIDLPGNIDWYYRNDVGVLLVYASDRLYRLDLLADEPALPEPLRIAGLDRERSVLPVARTGLLLIPAGVVDGTVPRSFAIDTLSGSIVWEANVLPEIDVLFSFPDAGLVVVRTPDDGGRLIAIDMTTGKRVWEITKWASLVWTERPFLRALVGDRLLTLDVRTGETVREDQAALPDSKRFFAFTDEGVFVLWNNRQFTGYSIPPIPPAPAAPARERWSFKAGSLMIDACIKAGNCRVRRMGHDVLYVRSAKRNEFVRLTTGESIVNVKKGFWGAPVSVSPTARFIAYAAGENMQILDGATGDVLHAIAYPKGGEGMKTLRYMTWPSEDVVMTVFPDKKGNPKKMSGFSCVDGALKWTVVLPDVAGYVLTSDQRSKLVGRIVSSLLMTAASVANPVSVGGDSYFAVFVPDLRVSDALVSAVTATEPGGAGAGSPFTAALERFTECERRIAGTRASSRYFVAGDPGSYDILRIDLLDGDVETVQRYGGSTVHAIAPMPAFERAVTLENDHRTVRLLRLR